MRVGNAALIPPATRRDELVKLKYDTADIVREVLDIFKTNKTQLLQFAQTLRGASDRETCKNIFDFIKSNIRYQVDPAKVQWGKTPARLFADKVGDCKSFSIFAASCLDALKIPFAIRFVSFSGVPLPTHVYVVAFDKASKEIKIDAVIAAFDTETPYTHKIDYMEGLYRMSGIGAAGAGKLPVVDAQYGTGKPVYNPAPGEFQVPTLADGSTSDELIEAAILKQRMEIQASMMNRVAGISGTVQEISAQAIAELDNKIKAAISGTEPAVGGFFKKVFNVVKKVVTAPIKLVQKVVMAPFALILNKQLPPASMGFLYIFIPDGVCEKMPSIICKKRTKQLKMMKAICSIVQMKESHFRGLIENGIMKKTGKSPVAYLSEKFKMQISGVGQGIGVVTAIIGVVLKLVGAIVGLFKKKSPDLPANEKEAADAVAADSDIVDVTNEAVTALELIPTPPSAIEKVITAAANVADTVAQQQQAQQIQQTYDAANQLPAVQPLPFTGVNPDYATQQTYADPAQQQYAQQQYAMAPEPQTATTGGMDTKTLLIAGGLGLAVVLPMLMKRGR